MATQKGGEDGGVFGFLFWETLFLGREVVAVVDCGLAASAVDFERAEEEVGFSLGCLKPSKRVGHEKAGGVGQIGDLIGVADKKTGGSSHG